MPPPFDPTGPGTPSLPGDEDAIPLLTEIVEPPREPRTGLPATLGEADWSALARQVEDDVLVRLMHHSEALFAQSLRSTLDAVIERATVQLQLDLESAISQLTRDVVARAVADELARVQAEIGQQAPGAGPEPAGDDALARRDDALRPGSDPHRPGDRAPI